MVEEVGCNLKVVERSEATAYVVLERSVKVVERIIYARHTAESMRVMRHQQAGLSSSLPQGCRQSSQPLSTRQSLSWSGVLQRSSWKTSREVRASIVLAGRAPAGHTERERAVSSGQSRPLREDR